MVSDDSESKSDVVRSGYCLDMAEYHPWSTSEIATWARAIEVGVLEELSFPLVSRRVMLLNTMYILQLSTHSTGFLA